MSQDTTFAQHGSPEISPEVSPLFDLETALEGASGAGSASELTFSSKLGLKYLYLSPQHVEVEMVVGRGQCRATAHGFILHGGATLAAAETIAGVGSLLSCAGRFNPCGVSVTAHHVSMAKIHAVLTVKADIINQSGHTHLWNIDFYKEGGVLVSTIRVTNALIPERPAQA